VGSGEDRNPETTSSVSSMESAARKRFTNPVPPEGEPARKKLRLADWDGDVVMGNHAMTPDGDIEMESVFRPQRKYDAAQLW
jgi:hypothetical protein